MSSANLSALRQYQAWRRGGDGPAPDPKELGRVIDWAIEVCEAAEKSKVVPIDINDHAIAMLRNALQKQYAFVLCIEIGENGLGKVCTHNRDDELVAARMLERFARWQRGMR